MPGKGNASGKKRLIIPLPNLLVFKMSSLQHPMPDVEGRSADLEPRSMDLQFDFDIDAGGQREPHQVVDGLAAGGDDIQQAFVRPDLELLA